MVLQAHVRCFNLQQGVFNNAKRKWQIIDTKGDFQHEAFIDLYERFYKAQKGGNI
jgi:hypothetical protein